MASPLPPLGACQIQILSLAAGWGTSGQHGQLSRLRPTDPRRPAVLRRLLGPSTGRPTRLAGVASHADGSARRGRCNRAQHGRPDPCRAARLAAREPTGHDDAPTVRPGCRSASWCGVSRAPRGRRCTATAAGIEPAMRVGVRVLVRQIIRSSKSAWGVHALARGRSRQPRAHIAEAGVSPGPTSRPSGRHAVSQRREPAGGARAHRRPLGDRVQAQQQPGAPASPARRRRSTLRGAEC